MPGWELGAQFRNHVGIGGHAVDICHWQLRGPMEGEFDIEAGRGSRYRCFVESAGRFIVNFLALAMFCGLALELIGFCVDFCGDTEGVMAIGLAWGFLVRHGHMYNSSEGMSENAWQWATGSRCCSGQDCRGCCGEVVLVIIELYQAFQPGGPTNWVTRVGDQGPARLP